MQWFRRIFFKKKWNKENPSISQYWIQEVVLRRVHEREDVFKSYLEKKKVLHIGCTDHPIFDPNNNLHIRISKYVGELHGMDVDEIGLAELSNYFNGQYFSKISDVVKNNYDTVLVPETIEHVENIKIFLEEIESINANNYIITGPNAFHDFFKNSLDVKTGLFTEAVHPDHNCWFSPYTLKNIIEKYTKLNVNEIFLCNHDLMIVCICNRQSSLNVY